VRHLSYLGLLAACLLATAPLELLLRTRVYRRPRRLALALVPGFVIGVLWDFYAVHRGQWAWDRRYLLGWRIAELPIEELLFFMIIPTCAILTLEAVRRSRPTWLIGDEPGEQSARPPKSAEP